MADKVLCAECGKEIEGEPGHSDQREGPLCEACVTILTPTGARWVEERLEQYRKRRRSTGQFRRRP